MGQDHAFGADTFGRLLTRTPFEHSYTFRLVESPSTPGGSAGSAVDAIDTQPPQPDTDTESTAEARAPSGRKDTNARRRPLFIIALVALLATPLVVALIALLHPRWYPLLDMAWTEMRVRDVGSSHPPLVGLTGRIGSVGDQGSHPGPLSFYALWPFYQLFGAGSWGLEAASVALQVTAIGVLLWIANRRGGIGLVLAVAAGLAVLLRAYGAVLLTQPWNPYLPVLWWLVFLFAIWSVLCGDLMLLPVAALTGSFCAQTEVAYLGLCAGLGLLAVGVAGWRARQQRADPRALRQFARWVLLAGIVTVLVWIPPVVQQITTSRGNLSVLFDYFGSPPESPVGLMEGLKVLLSHLNPVTPVTHALVPTASNTDVTIGSVVPGSVLLGLFVMSAVVAWRLRLRPLLELHAVIGATLVLGLISISRIFGILWYYLVLWAWGVDILVVIAIGWTAAVLVGRRLRDSQRQRARAGSRAALAAAALVFTILFAVEAAGTEFPTPRLSRTLAAVVNPTVNALERRPGPTGGRAGRYLVTFGDGASLGAQGFGLMNELEREGFTIGAPEFYRGEVTPHRVLSAENADAVVHLSIGSDIAVWRAKSGAREVAFFDPRSRKERAEYARLHAKIVAELQAAGLSELVPRVDTRLFAITLDPRVPKQTRRDLARLADLGLPAAVFIAPNSIAT